MFAPTNGKVCTTGSGRVAEIIGQTGIDPKYDREVVSSVANKALQCFVMGMMHVVYEAVTTTVVSSGPTRYSPGKIANGQQ